MKKKKLFLLDMYPILYRSHFAMLNQHLVNSAGLNTSAILGFCNYLFQIIFKEKPSHIAAAFDSRSLERTTALKTYKGTREKMPEDIVVAKDYVKRIIDALTIKIIELKGFEADDVIGTIAQMAARQGFEVFIVSPDKDFAQLVSDSISLYRPPYKGLNFEVLNSEGVTKKYGVPPEKISDLLALKGDPVDSISGIPKIGEKTAIELLNAFNSVEELLARKEEVSKKSIRETLTLHEETARLCKSLATINTHLPVDFSEKDFQLQAPNIEMLVQVLDELEFVRLKERIFSNSFYKKAFESETSDAKELGEKEMQSCRYVTITSGPVLEKILTQLKRDKRMCFLSDIKDEYADFYFLVNKKVYALSIKGSNVPASLVSIFQSPWVDKITYDTKKLFKFLYAHQVDMQGNIYDILLEHYVISPNANHQFNKIIAQELGRSLNGKYVSRQTKCLESVFLKEVQDKMLTGLQDNLQLKLYKDIDLPLAKVLAKMEMNGIKIDQFSLKEVSGIFQEEMDWVEKRIFEIASKKINLKSSKQTAGLLSEIFKDKTFKKTKTGQISTSESSLTELAEEHEIAEQLLRFRRLSKLISTYTDSLPQYINTQTGRIHADFRQTTTATGRLSCINPNLQNLPIRTEEGREIRKAVVPENEEYLILSADYSQIELRLLAGLSKDEGLANAFAERQDVHTITAAKVFNVEESEVTDDMRSKAKMVNYGIAYGISAFGLSHNLKITMSEAKEIINQYFKKFPGIRKYIDGSIDFAREHGYSQTATGRRRYIDDINSRNGTERRAAERLAINAPIQGLAADMIKISMIHIDEYIKSRNLKSKMILQVHDELVFEVYKPELKEIAAMVNEKMEHAIDLSVPVEVNIGVGENWMELEEYPND